MLGMAVFANYFQKECISCFDRSIIFSLNICVVQFVRKQTISVNIAASVVCVLDTSPIFSKALRIRALAQFNGCHREIKNLSDFRQPSYLVKRHIAFRFRPLVLRPRLSCGFAIIAENKTINT
jgi:hypothetical protein